MFGWIRDARARHTRRALLAAAAILGFSALPGGARAQQRDLTVVSWGGAYQDIQREIFFRPFQARSNTRLLEETWDGGVGVLRAKIQSGANNWDLVQVESEELLLGCEEGLFERMDWDAIGGRDHYVPQAVSDCGVGTIIYAFVLAYDRNRMANGPTDWAGFFDTKRFPGKRALRRGPKTTLEIALMADGVPAADVYKVLATPAGVDRAFRKLDTLRDSLIWWERGSQPPQLLASGDAAMVVAYNGRIHAANQQDGQNFAISWPGNLYTVDSWVIMKGSPNKARALDFLRFVGEREVQAAMPPRIPYGMVAKGVNELLPPEVRENLVTSPTNLQSALRIDDQFWLDNLDRLNSRFNTWLSR